MTVRPTLFPLVWAVWPVAALSSLPQSPPVSKATLAPLAAWVNESGTKTVIRAPIAQALGFPNVDLAVRERGLRREGERLTHVCSTIAGPGYSDVVFFALVDERTGNAIVWRANRGGDLISSVRFFNGEAKAIPNEETLAVFLEEKQYLLRQMRDQLFRANPTRPVSPSPTPMPGARLPK